MNITESAVKRPVATSMVFIALSLLGAVSYYLLPVQLLPNLVFPQLQVVVQLPGASTSEVEDQLVIPVEGAIASLEGIESINTSIYPGYASIVTSFDYGTDMPHAYLQLEQRASALRREIPEQAFLQVNRFDTSDFTNMLMQLVVTGSGDVDRLRNLADEDIVPALESIDGIVNVSAYGGKQFAVEVIVDEDKCEAYGVSLWEIGQTIAAFNRRAEYLGDVTDKGVRYFVSLTGQFNDITTLRELPIGQMGQVRLKDLAEVRFGRKDADRISRIDGEQAVMLVLRKDDLANMLRVAKNVYREIDRLNIQLAEHGVQIKIVMDSAEMVADSIYRVEKLAGFGVALAVGVLLMFLKRLRTVAIILVAIPVSLLITFNLMYYAGLSINLLSLVGFALAVGLLVDNGVVVIENTFRCAARAKNGIEAAIQGTKEVSMPIFAMTGTTLIVFLPIFFLVEGENKLMLAEFVYSIGSPLLISVFVSLTLVPMLAARTIDHRVASERKNSRFAEMYMAVLKAVLRRRGFAMVMTVVLFFFTLIVCLTAVSSFPSVSEPLDRVEYELQFPRGTPIETASRLTAKLEDIGKEFQDVKMINSTIEPEQAQVTIEFLDIEDRTAELDIGAIKREIEKRVETIEGLGPDRVWSAQDGRSFGGGKNATSMDAMGGFGSQERIEVRGEDPEALERIALQIEQRLTRAFENYMSRPRTVTQPGGPELEIRGQRDILARWGLTMSDLTSVIWLTRPRGDEMVVPFRTKDQDIDIVVRLKDGKERTVSDLERMRLRTPDGHYLDLAEVAEFKISESSQQIVRLDQQHEIRVHYAFRWDVARSSSRLKELQAQVDDVIGDMKFPEGYTVKIVHKEETDYSLLWTLIASVVCVFLLLGALFEELSTPLCVMTTLPLAVIGALWGLVITQTGLGNPTVAAGFLMLAGIVVNDAILTLGQARLLLKKGYSRRRAMLEGGRNRLRPIMMTTATTVLAMLPLAIRVGGENEIWPPFAITVIFGLIASTFFTLVFIPAMYLSLDDIRKWLKSIGLLGLAVAAGSTAALFYFGFMRASWVEQWAWRIVLTPTFFFAVAAIIWMMIRTVTAVKHVSVFQDEDVHVSISNLTKVFGADSRLARDWKLARRREARMRASGETLVNKRHLREDLIWKLPLLGLLIYFHNYFDNLAWLFVTACATWASLHDLAQTAGKLVEGDAFLDIELHQSRWRRTLWRSAVRLPVFLLTCYFYWELRAQWWFAILFFAVALVLHWLHDLAAHVRRTGIDLPAPTGPLGRLRRAALRIPIIAGVKPQVHALREVNLEIGNGVFGLLGPNGAGKTTLMRILTNIYEPTCGCIRINGRNVHDLRADVQPIIGYLPQHFGLYGNFTIWDYLTYFALLNDILDKDERETLVKKVIQDVGLEDRERDRISSLSGGMKQRVGIAQTLLHLPKIIVVDEPTAGLDPMERIRFRNLLAELGKDRIVVFSTHITEDVMSACHDLAVLDDSRVVFRGAPEELQRMAEGRVREAVVSPADVRDLTERVDVISQVTEAQGIRMRFIVQDGSEEIGEDVDPSLEDAYLYLLRTAEEPA